MKANENLYGQIIHLITRKTEFGLRSQAKIECIDPQTGEVTEPTVVAWREEAEILQTLRLGGHASLTGYWKKLEDGTKRFNVKTVTPYRQIAITPEIQAKYNTPGRVPANA